MLNAAQGKHLAVQHHEIVAQMHKYVLIAVELSVQGRQKRLLTQSGAILHLYVRTRGARFIFKHGQLRPHEPYR